jgi:hypothetical protein
LPPQSATGSNFTGTFGLSDEPEKEAPSSWFGGKKGDKKKKDSGSWFGGGGAKESKSNAAPVDPLDQFFVDGQSSASSGFDGSGFGLDDDNDDLGIPEASPAAVMSPASAAPDWSDNSWQEDEDVGGAARKPEGSKDFSKTKAENDLRECGILALHSFHLLPSQRM